MGPVQPIQSQEKAHIPTHSSSNKDQQPIWIIGRAELFPRRVYVEMIVTANN